MTLEKRASTYVEARFSSTYFCAEICKGMSPKPKNHSPRPILFQFAYILLSTFHISGREFLKQTLSTFL